jgi:trehalose synthase
VLQEVKLSERSLAAYRPIVGDAAIEEIRGLAAPLQGARVLHINATAFGGGVAEILATLVPLMRDVGLDAHWQVIGGTDEFFAVTKALHNGLQGMDVPLPPAMQETYLHHNRGFAEAFKGEYDLIVVHDPQPAALKHFLQPRFGRWLWRCHIDTSTPSPTIWQFVKPFVDQYDALIFTLQDFASPDLKAKRTAFIAPSIDPLSPKNAPLPAAESQAIVRRFGLEPERPLLVQVSRFDPWKDPLGVIDAYRLVKRQMPDMQLALIGSMASDDPEGWDFYDRTLRHAGEDFDVRVLHNFHGVGNREVNAFQREADVVIQKSTREGFGLVVAEALWKGKPVVGGRAGGIPLQVLDGQTGYLVDSVEACADKVLALLRQPDLAQQMGQHGREHVRQNFLSTRNLRDYLRLFAALR